MCQPMGLEKADDAGKAAKARLREELRAALKERRQDEVKVLRSLIAAIDNAEAPPLAAVEATSAVETSGVDTTEVDRLELTGADLRRLLTGEIEEREHAAAELERRDQPERAAALRAEVSLVRRYLG